MDLPFTSAEITAFKDIALAISAMATASAAVATATFAYKGLNKWKSEARFQDRFQLAKEVVETTYKASEVVSRLAAPIHILHAASLAERLPEQKIKPLNEYKDKLSSLNIQARALYGEEQAKPIKDYILAIDDVLAACQIFLDNYNHIEGINLALESGVITGKDELEQAEIEIEAFTERMNRSKFYIIRKPNMEKIKAMKGFASVALEHVLLHTLNKDVNTGIIYNSEEAALDSLVKSMQSYLGD
ncbi:hypothetical protein H4J45_09740 [Colwellia sp. BRX10-6]|uniref:hypothetical protein n=1 Tax=unclassified Colwellia TaxID=196834 RepID=UPI0015F6F12F|nr:MULTISPECIES: hypothetical protein [unclassified Colwellia]MBA6383655.1 hypothetical protein [Colwellia sp. BRX10-9]MBA6394365.1 hypothetical protein [Colwellia sp. BRX10-6]